ncbi:DNA polymerase [Halorubrum sp. Ib24]|uniref:DNA polymerase n=1 Tax=Halorubrum sp. Ib24 TaxID=1383850 RepID=UPI00117A5E62|nr:DNA polymerase [Halorubrum sp. Ib24]
MPLEFSADALREIVRLVLAIRKDGECRIDVDEEQLRLRACSEDKIAYLDYSLPTDAAVCSTDVVTGSYWVELEGLDDLIRVGTTGEVSVALPPETPNSRIALQSGGLTYRFPALAEQLSHRVYDGFSTETRCECVLPNSVFDRAVKVADLIGPELQVQFDSVTQFVEFAAEGDKSQDAFSHSHAVRQPESVDNSVESLTVPVARLQDITPRVPAAMPVSLGIDTHYLTYQTEGPVEGGDLTVYTAKRYGKIG